MNRNKFCKEIKNKWNEYKKKFRIINKGSNYFILKWLKFVLLFLKPLGIISILCFLVTKFPFGKSYLQNQKKPFQVQKLQDFLVIISFIALAMVLFKNYRSCWILIFIGWRVSEILVVQLSIVFLSENDKITTANFNRSIILFLINIFEVIFAFAIFYLNNRAIGYCTNNQTIKEPFEALYFSIITISTTGFGDIIPINRCGRILVFSEIAIGILLLVIFFGIFISKWKSKNDRFYQLLIKVYRQKNIKP